MYQVIDDNKEQEKFNKIVKKITPQSLGLKPTNDFAQYAMQEIINEEPEKAQQWANKGQIGIMEAGKDYANEFKGLEEFDGNYHNVKENNTDYSKFQKAGQNLIKSIGGKLNKIYDFEKVGQEQIKNPVYNPLYGRVEKNENRPAIYDENKLNKQIGFLEGLENGILSGEATPFIGNRIKGNRKKKLRTIADKIRNNEQITQKELNYFNYYREKEYEKQIRGYTIGGQIGEAILPSLLAFGGEMMFGGLALKGIGLAGKGLGMGVSLGKNLLRSGQVSKKVAKGVAFTTGHLAESGISATITTAINSPTSLFATYQERRLNDEMKITDRGTVIFADAEESPAKAFLKSLGQVFISYYTEGLGLLIGAPFKASGHAIGAGAMQFKRVLEASPALEKFIKKTTPLLAKGYENLNKLPIKGKSVDWLKSQVKFDGFIEELGEEVLEDVLNLAIGTNNEERSLENYVSKIVKSPEEWAVLCGVIALQGSTLSIAGNTLGHIMQKNGASFKDIAHVSKNSTEAEKIDLVDEAIKRGDITIPENALSDNVEIQKEEIEQKTFEKFRKGNVDETQAVAYSKLFGQFFKQYGSKSKEAFDKWFNKFDVRYNVPANQNQGIKQNFQAAEIKANKEKYIATDKVYDNFVNVHDELKLIEKIPEYWNGETLEDALKYLRIKDNKGIKIKSPIEEITIYKSHMEHLINDNNAHRKKYLNRAIRTIEDPNIIVKNGAYNNYIKLFSDKNKNIKPHLQIVKVKNDGNFYVTNYKLIKKQLKKTIIEGQVVYDLSSMSSTKSTDTNIITDGKEKLNPNVNKHEEKTYFQEADSQTGYDVQQEDNLVDLTDDFKKTPTIDEVKNYINEIIEKGTKFATLSPEWFVDIKGGNRVKGKILNRGNYKKLNKSQTERHNKYIMSLEKLLNNAQYVGEKENTKKDKKPNIQKYHYFKTNVKIRGKAYEIIFDTEEYTYKKPQSVDYAKRNSNGHSEDTISITSSVDNFNPKTVHLYNITEIKKPKIIYQESNTVEDEKMIAGYTYQEVMEKLSDLYSQLNDKDISKEETDKILTKVHYLEDAFDVAEHPEKYNDSEKSNEIMLNAYYIMNNQEIPKEYVEADKASLRSFNDYLEIHNEKKRKAEEKYYGYFTESKDKNIITIMSNHNSSTALHELGHLFLNGLNELAKVDENAKRQLEEVNRWLGFSGEYTIEQQEKFARSFEAYLYKGKAPNSYLRQVFENFKEWLNSVYSHITELVDKGADISSEVQELFDKMFSDNEYYQEKKQADELLKKVKNLSRKEKMNKIQARKEDRLDEVEKRHKKAAYDILSTATGKSVKYLKSIFETNLDNKALAKKRETIEILLDDVQDKIKISGGMREEWKEFFADTGISYDNNEINADYELARSALDTIVNKKYRNPEKDYLFDAENRARYYSHIVDEADRQYKVLIKSYEKENRNVALSAIYEWLEGLDSEIKQDYEDKFIFDSAMIERKENEDKFDKAKRKIIEKALEVERMYSLTEDEKYKEVVKEIMKNLSFLQPSDKAKLTVNILDVPSINFLMSSIDNILDIAKTMEDVNYRRNLQNRIHSELQKTKNIKKNGHTVGKYDYKTNKIFEELRELDKLTPEKANELRLDLAKFAANEDNGLSYKDKLINKFLSYKAGGKTFNDTELVKSLYDEILKIKLVGKASKSELDLMEKLDETKDIDELINIVQNKKIAKLSLKAYISGLGNLESTINAIFNKDIKEKYASEILYDETQSQAFQYKVKTDFENEVAKIYNLPSWLWDKKIIEYLGEKHTYQEIRRKYDKNGEIVKSRLIDRTLTKMDIIQAYIWSNNKVLEKRLKNQFGELTLEKMFDELSIEDVKFAELMMRTAQSFYPLVNKAFIEKYGLDLPKVSCYFPSTPERGSEVDLYNDYSSKSLNNSFTKARGNTEILPMDFHNPVATLYNHIDGVSKFVFMSKNLDIINKRFKDLDLKRVIINKFGEDAYRTLEQILMNITYKKEAPVFNGVDKIINNMVSNWIQANVTIKPIVGLKQLLSANNYAVDMPYMTWQKGFLKALVNPKETISYMMKIPYIKARYGGNISNEFLKETIENSAFAITKKFKDCCSIFIKMGDIGAIIFGGKPYIDYLINEKGMSEQEAIKQFILSTNRSQQSSAISSLSNFQVAMTRNPFGKLFIAFKNSPQQYVRMCGDAIVSVANGDMTKRQCAKLLFQYAYLQPFLYAVATSGSLFKLLFTKDDEDLLKDLKMSIFNLNANAIPLLGDIYSYAMNRLAYKEKYMPQVTPLLGDVQNEINKISKEDVKLSDYLEAIGYMMLHIGFGVNSKAIGSMSSGFVDVVSGDVTKGSMKVLGYTDKRVKNITKGGKN